VELTLQPLPSVLAARTLFTVSVSATEDTVISLSSEGAPLSGVTLQAATDGGSVTFQVAFEHGASGVRVIASSPSGESIRSAPMDVEERSLVITELLMEGPESAQFLELFNTSAAAIPLHGIQVVVGNGPSFAATINARDSAQLAPGAYAVIRRAAFPGTAPLELWEADGFSLSAPVVRVLDVNGRLLDVLDAARVVMSGDVGPDQFPVSTSISTQFDLAAGAANDRADTWCLSFPSSSTPGQPNTACQVSAAGHLLIHEFMPGAFLELRGGGGWVVPDLVVTLGAANISIPASTRLPTNGLLFFAPVAASTTVELRAGAQILDAMTTPALSPGSSFARGGIADPVEDTSPTPGEPNGFPDTHLSALMPDNAPAGAGATPQVVLSGAGLSDMTQVRLGDQPLGCTADAQHIVCTVPEGAEGRAPVEVKFSSGIVLRVADAFTYHQAINESGSPLEMDYCALVTPQTLQVVLGQPTALVEGRVFKAGVTTGTQNGGSVTAQLGYGPEGSDPRSSTGWRFFPSSWVHRDGTDEVYRVALVPAQEGTFRFGYRFSLDAGLHWTYCDQDGAGTDPNLDFNPAQLGTMTVSTP